MKRIVREVITLIRIERWLVVDERHDSPMSEPEVMEWSLSEVDLNDAEASMYVEVAPVAKVADCSTADGAHVVSQRVLEIDKWEVKREK